MSQRGQSSCAAFAVDASAGASSAIPSADKQPGARALAPRRRTHQRPVAVPVRKATRATRCATDSGERTLSLSSRLGGSSALAVARTLEASARSNMPSCARIRLSDLFPRLPFAPVFSGSRTKGWNAGCARHGWEQPPPTTEAGRCSCELAQRQRRPRSWRRREQQAVGVARRARGAGEAGAGEERGRGHAPCCRVGAPRGTLT